MYSLSTDSPFYQKKELSADYAPFLGAVVASSLICGKKCKNKRERERIENEARAVQLAQEAKIREQEIAQAALFTQQQAALDKLQNDLQQNLVAREQEIAPEPASYTWVWVLLGVAVLGAGAWWYFKK